MPQTPRLSKWEVGVDLGLGTAVNVGIQAFLLRTFTLSQGLSFAMVFLGLAYLRRYWVRRGFNRLVPPGAGQSRRMSVIEVVTDTLIAIAVAFALLAMWYPAEPLPRISSLVLIAYVLTPLGRFLLRRFFEALAGAPHRA
ncbi:MAG: hypothetical protein OEU26_35700 [Candidatus Tectomicrobia bacterium]|nr:hypothetical protein [Candidatus Tectomicrobia bacterium]